MNKKANAVAGSRKSLLLDYSTKHVTQQWKQISFRINNFSEGLYLVET